MCSCNEDCRPTSQLAVTVRYCHDHASWHGFVSTDSVTVGGKTINTSRGTHEFGPFDSSTEVGYWLSRQQGVLKGICHPDLFALLAES